MNIKLDISLISKEGVLETLYSIEYHTRVNPSVMSINPNTHPFTL